jgi:pyruvate/2-oxoglutarate dehydrogenase complex dihydrolipoamide acyltransferase (E2) component
MPQKTAPKKNAPKTPSARRRRVAATPATRRVARAYDEDDVLSGDGTAPGLVFGRCGGRILTTKIEQTICDLLSDHGITHSHSPRHFEVQIDERSVGAYAPMIVLRGKGREGKTVVVEACESTDKVTLTKITAFRAQYGAEFYLCFIAPEDVLDEVSIRAYDEASTTTDARTLVSRLAE